MSLKVWTRHRAASRTQATRLEVTGMEERIDGSTAEMTAEEVVETTSPVTEEVPEEVSEDAGAPETETADEGEPGGASPQEIRARKEYRARKRAEDAAQQEREQRIAAEARLKLIEDQAKQRAAQTVPKPARRFTTAEVLQAVNNGPNGIQMAEAIEYIFETKDLARRQVEQQRHSREQQVSAAQSELREYFEVDPRLKTSEHPKAKEIAARYSDIVTRLGMPRTHAAMLLAYREVLGPVERLRQVKETTKMTRQTRDTHVETSGGKGDAGHSSNPLARVPAHFIKHWQDRGYSREEMIKEAKYITEDRLKPR